ncbi:MAG: hypothetical protein JNK12_17555 [Acidimicrobiales bacterium]|nr:hypothetical protein [Acidimicrobiales bacterium]
MSDDAQDLVGRWARSTDPGRDPIGGAEVRARAASGGVHVAAADSGRRGWVLAAACVFVAVALGAAILARSGGDDVVVQTGPAAGSEDGPGSITVQLEPDVCCFREGFEVGLRFETADGEVIGSTLWSDFVEASGDDSMGAYYDSVLTQEVQAGPVVVRAEVSIGAGPPPVPPDLEGDLACSLEVEVAPDETVAVEVLFDEADDCLRRLTDPPTTTNTSQAPTTTMPLTTTSVGPVTEAPMTTTSIASLAAGVGYYVDVDLDCLAFELSGIWVLVDGDPRSWQPADERFEGGTFTLDSLSTGTFVGDFAETKVATFRLLAGDETPNCVPVPRYAP